jgi:hypothetical protein
VLIEGRWRQQAGEEGKSPRPYAAGADALPWSGGIGATDLAACVRPLVAEVRVESLSGVPELWGGPVADERYVLINPANAAGRSGCSRRSAPRARPSVSSREGC